MALVGQISRDDIESCPSFSAYTDLNEKIREIRLVRVECNKLTFEHASLDDAPEYVAVSYHWGDPTPTHYVQLDGEQIELRQTVWALINSLRHKYQTILIWLDMLCINQRDLKERNSQVSMMGDIYRKAKSVHAWLGESAADTDIVFNALKEFSHYKRQNDAELDDDEAIRLSHYREKFFSIYESQSQISHDAGGSHYNDPTLLEEFNWLWPLFSRPYWQRVWIVQELILPRSVIVFCGNHFIDFNDIYGLSLDWGHFGQAFGTKLYKKSISKGWYTISAIRDHRDLRCEVPLAEIIEVYCMNHKCSNIRDKVYGFRALASVLGCLQVEYSKKVLDIFVEVVKLGLENQKLSISTARYLLRSMELTWSDLLVNLEFHANERFPVSVRPVASVIECEMKQAIPAEQDSCLTLEVCDFNGATHESNSSCWVDAGKIQYGDYFCVDNKALWHRNPDSQALIVVRKSCTEPPKVIAYSVPRRATDIRADWITDQGYICVKSEPTTRSCVMLDLDRRALASMLSS